MKSLTMAPYVFFVILGVSFSFPSHAAEIGFGEIWSSIQSRSNSIKGARLEAGIAEKASERASLHWLPSLSLGGRYFTTNDPGVSLFSRLGQRQILSSDFGPAALNEPGFQNYGFLSLQAELPIYEGGAKESLRAAAAYWQESQERLLDAREIGLHARTASDFGRILSLHHAKKQSLALRTEIEKILGRYSLGSRSNPVGYSGMLGLKALQNRILSVLESFRSEEAGLKARISTLAGIDAAWIPRDGLVIGFVEENLPKPAARIPTREEEAARLAALGADEQANSEKSRYLPGVGLFGNESWNTGARGSAFTTTAGVYLRWSLFTPDSWNRQSEAELRSKRESLRAEEASEQTKISFEGLSAHAAALESNLKLVSESEELLAEQTRITLRLFRDGAIGALSLAEALNRRVDLLLDRVRLESSWIEDRSALQNYRSKEGVRE